MSKIKTQILNYTVHIKPSEDGGFDVSVPALSGCLTQGDTYEEAISMARECIHGFIEL
jgi:predicted RNase H-like HicB family nuclease